MKQKSCVGFLCVLAGLFGALAQAQSPAPKPKLVLAVVIDQFRYDYLTRFRADYHGGLARLLDQGAVFTDAHYPQFPTVTAVGHSTFMSGATPSVSGIINNEWYDRAAKQSVTSVFDGSTKLVGGVPGVAGSSPRRLLVSSFPDELKIAGKAGKVIGISIKDRSAILPAGHMADAAYWFDGDSNHWVTSDYYSKELPTWVAAVNEAQPASRYLGAEWLPLDAKPGDAPYCTLVAGSEKAPFCGSLEATPYGNELIAELAGKALVNEGLGTHSGTDVLAVSFSSNDYVGHALGSDHPAIRDISIRTDILLGKLMDLIDSRIGKGQTLVVLTADHGVAPVPEVNEERRMPGGRLDAQSIASQLSQALVKKFGPGEWLLSASSGSIYLNYETAAKNKASLAEVRRFAAAALRETPHIARVFTSDALLAAEGAGDPIGHAIQVGFYAPRSGDLTVVQEPYYLFGSSGTSHSTPYDYDTHVPVLFYGPGIKSGVQRGKVYVNDIAPTLASIFEVETPSGAFGRILTEILQ
jgi:predicted AlkP superfamily pyrophosphatase or phosphodiesterase